MTANELLNKQVKDATFQLEKVLEGVNEKDLDFKLAPTSMSIRELVEHLCEVYTALEAESRGASHAWGSFSLEDKSWSNLIAQHSAMRSKATAIAAAAHEEKQIFAASAYLVTHDCYHVGQLASIRMATDPSWNPYSVYPSD